MNEKLKRLMAHARLMAEHEEGSVGGNSVDNDHDDDDDDHDDNDGDQGSQASQQVEGDADIQYVVDEEDAGEQNVSQNPEENKGQETQEEKLERRRKERHERKQRQKEKEESTKRELQATRRTNQELEQRLAALEGRDRSREIAQVDEGINRAARAYEHHKAKLAEAMEQHDGAAAALATEKMAEAKDASRQLTSLKQSVENAQKQPRPAANPTVINYAQKFMSDNPWYKHGTSDTDSRIVAQLDADMPAEGWDPATPEYWQELRARIKKYLPHRVAGGKLDASDKKPNPPRQNKSVVSGGGGESQSGGQVFKLSKERVQAIKDAGMWNDVEKRNSMIKTYREYDKKMNKKG